MTAARPKPRTFTVLHRFAGFPTDGEVPNSPLLDVGGTLYGTTVNGSANGDGNLGTVFKMTTSGQETILYNFAGGSDGANPYAGLIDVGDALYGTTSRGGSGCGNYNDGCGTVFRVTSGKETVLYRFANTPDGAQPYAALINAEGALYGTTYEGGRDGFGTIFKITASGKESVLYSFHGVSDGRNPYSSLIEAGGTLYGTTVYGGRSGAGTIFSITTSGAKYKQLYTFDGGSDGASPYGALLDVGGTLYGTTYGGGLTGRSTICGTAGCGTVFKVGTSGSGYKQLYKFEDGSNATTADGAGPFGNLIDVSGTLYGTTLSGGEGDEGTVFRITTPGVESSVFSFAGNSGGAEPSGLVPLQGTLYGTATGGGTQCFCGIVFSLQP